MHTKNKSTLTISYVICAATDEMSLCWLEAHLLLYISDLLCCLIARHPRHNQLNKDHIKQKTIR